MRVNPIPLAVFIKFNVGNGLDRSATKKRGALTSLVKGRGTIANGDGGEIYLILTPFLCSESATDFDVIGRLVRLNVAGG